MKNAQKVHKKIMIALILLVVCCISFLLLNVKTTDASTWDNAEDFANTYLNGIAYNPNDNYIYYGSNAILSAPGRIGYQSLGHVIRIKGTDKNVQVKIGESEQLVDKRNEGVGTREYLLYKITYQDLINLFAVKYGMDDNEIQKLYTAPITYFVVDTIITIVNTNGSYRGDIFENGSGDAECKNRDNVAFNENEMGDLWYNATGKNRDFSEYYNLSISIINKKFISTDSMQITKSDNNASPIYQSGDRYYVHQNQNFKLRYNTYAINSYSPPNRAYFKIKNAPGWQQVVSNTYFNIDNGQDSSSTIAQDSNQPAYAVIIGGDSIRSSESKMLTSTIEYHMDTDGVGLKFYPYATIQYKERPLANSGDWDDSKAVYVISDGKAPDITNIDSSYGWTNQNVTLDPTVTDSGSGVKSKDVYNADNNTWLGNSSVTLSSEGITNIKVKSSDNVGNESEFNTTVKIDKTAPDIIINGNKNNGDNYFVTWNKDDYQLFLESKDTYSGVKSFYVTDLDGIVTNSTGNNISMNVTKEGIHKYTVTAIDNTGNMRTRNITVEIDKTAPDITLNGNTDNNISIGWTNQNAIVNTNVRDGLSGIAKISVKDQSNNIIFDQDYSSEASLIERLRKDYITRIYQTSFHRNPDANEMNVWYNCYIRENPSSSGDILWTILNSNKFLPNMSNEDFLSLLYYTALDREPDQPAYNNWLDFFQRGASRNEVIGAFITSAEYYDISSKYGVPIRINLQYRNNDKAQWIEDLKRTYINRCYNKLFSRNADQGELDTWSNYLTGKDKVGEFIVNLVAGQGGCQNLNNDEFEQLMFQLVLNRYDSGTYAQNLTDDIHNRLANGLDRFAFIREIASSSEFNEVTENYGIPTYPNSFTPPSNPTWENAYNSYDLYSGIDLVTNVDFKFYAANDGVNHYTVTTTDNAGNNRNQIVTTLINKGGLKLNLPDYDWTNQNVDMIGSINNSNPVNMHEELFYQNKNGNSQSVGNWDNQGEIHHTVTTQPYEGITHWKLKAWDDSGNATEMTNTVKIDVTPPVISGVEDEYRWTRQGSITAKISDDYKWSPQSGVARTELYRGSELLFTIKSDTLNYSFGDDGVNTYTIKAFDVAGNETDKTFKVTISYSAAYTINHYLMNTDGSTYTLKKTESLSGNIGASVTPEVLSFKGFTSPETQTVEIKANGSTVVDYYYTRNKYTIRFFGNGGEGSMPDVVNYNQDIELPTHTFTKENEEGESKFIGWNTDFTSYTALYEENGEIGDLGLPDNSVIDLFAIWDDYPIITAQDRYYSLDDAKEGKITEEDLLTTVSITDDWDTAFDDTLKVTYYDPDEWKQFTSDGSSLIQYEVTDSMGHTSYTRATVYIVDTTPQIVEDTKHVRFISPEFYQKPFEDGGLEDDSIWKTDPSYVALLESAMENRRSLVEEKGSITVFVVTYNYTKPGSISRNHMDQSWTFTHEDVLKVKEYISLHGLGNLQEENGLSNFLTQFAYCRKY